MSQINVTVIGSTAECSLVSNCDTVNVTFADQSGGAGTGTAATIEVGSVVTVTATESASVVNSGTGYAAKLDFKIPRGGAAGLAIGTVTSGTVAAATITGTAPSQVLSLTLPAGPANKLAVGTVTSGADPAATLSSPTVSNGVVSQTLDLVLPQGATGERGPVGLTGATGPANSLSVGTVTKGDEAAVAIAGNAPSQTISFVLPKGDKGDKGDAGPYTSVQVGSTTTGAPGTQASVSSAASGNTVTISFTIPRGADGTANLADETPQPLGTANAGTATKAARADHVHAVPAISYANLTNVPLTFAPATHQHAIGDVTNLQAVLDAKQPAGTYATLVNGAVPSSQLPGYVDDVVEYASSGSFPATGEAGKLYVALDTRKLWRWSGTGYVEIAASPGSTDAVPEGSTNLYFTTKRASDAAPVQSVNGKTGNVTIEAGGIAWSTVPTTTTSTTKAGSISYDPNYVYVATDVDTWRRAGLEDWTTPVITINTQPANQTAVGGAATFTVTASVTQGAELLYQWQRQAGGAGSWSDVSGGLSSSLTLTDLQYAVNNGDKYRVIITSGAAGTGGTAVSGWLPAVVVELTPTASATSDPATLTVLAAISITMQPQNVTLVSDTTAAFSVAATTPGSGLSYQWESSPDGTNWTTISGATNSTLSFTGLNQSNDQTRYRCVVSSSGYDNVTSVAAKLTVNPITVTTQPTSMTATPGTGTTPNYNATLTVAGTSPAGPPTLQWQVSTDSGSTWSDVSGATSSSLSLTGLGWSDSGKRYRARLTRTGWSEVTSNSATVAVPQDTIAVTQQPANTTAATSQWGSTASSLPAGTWHRISYANNRWFATPSNADFGGDYIATSPDGINWTKQTLALPVASSWARVLYYNGVYLTWRTSGDNVSPRFATSTDGVNWTGRTDSVFGLKGLSLSDIVVVPDVGFLMLTSSTVGGTAGAKSSDGVTWTTCPGGGSQAWPNASYVQDGQRVVSATGLIEYNSSYGYEARQYGVATSVGGSQAVYTPVIYDNIPPQSPVIVRAGGGYVYFCGQRAFFLSYANSSSTTPAISSISGLPGGDVLLGITVSGSRMIAAGANGFYTSNDSGTNWARRLSASVATETYYNPASDIGSFFVNGSRVVFFYTGVTNGAIYTSDDSGLTWTSRTVSVPSGGLLGGATVAGSRPFADSSQISFPAYNSSLALVGNSRITTGGINTASFSASASTLFGSPNIQWQRSTDGGSTWANVSGATSSPLSFAPASGDNGSRYRAVFSKDQYTTVNSNAATLTVP